MKNVQSMEIGWWMALPFVAGAAIDFYIVELGVWQRVQDRSICFIDERT